VPRVRVIGAEAEQLGILTRDEALALAQEAGMDLVEIQPNGDPPVCRKQKQVEIKEVKFRPVTDVGDYQIKLRNMLRFLEEGDKVKVTIRFRGREMSHQDLGQNLAKKIQEDVGENGQIESFPRLEGRQMVMMIGPKKKS
jgi:translation initiation factor IF-3